MKHKLHLFLITLLLLPILSCTSNNGDIGPLFGFWRLDEVTVNDVPENLYNGTGVELYAFAFQSNVMYIQTVKPHLDYDRAFGTWTLEGDRMTWHFNWTDDGNFTNYIAPPALLLDPSGVTVMDVVRLTSSHLETVYTDQSGNSIRYYLSKTK